MVRCNGRPEEVRGALLLRPRRAAAARAGDVRLLAHRPSGLLDPGLMTLQEAAAQAEALAQQGDERGLATLRQQWDEELEHAARDADYRVRAQAYRAIAQFRFRQKLELVRRGLQDESPAARGSALIALEGLSRDHPGDVNSMRALLHEIATNDTNAAVRRLAIVCLKNGSAQRETILILNGLADDDEQEQELRKAAKAVATALAKKGRN